MRKYLALIIAIILIVIIGYLFLKPVSNTSILQTNQILKKNPSMIEPIKTKSILSKIFKNHSIFDKLYHFGIAIESVKNNNILIKQQQNHHKRLFVGNVDTVSKDGQNVSNPPSLVPIAANSQNNNSRSNTATVGNLSNQQSSKTNEQINQQESEEIKPGESNTLVYISEYNNNQVSKCQLDKQKLLSQCVVALINLHGPQHLLVKNNLLYIVNANKTVLTVCKLDDDGNIGNCIEAELPELWLSYLTISGNQLIISDLTDTKAVSCNIANNQLVQCNNSDPRLTKAITNNEYFNNYSYSIVIESDYTQQLHKCIRNVCNTMYDSNISMPSDIKIYNNQAYITNVGTNSLVSCSIKTTGDFYNCQLVKGGFSMPIGIAFYSKGHS